MRDRRQAGPLRAAGWAALYALTGTGRRHGDHMRHAALKILGSSTAMHGGLLVALRLVLAHFGIVIPWDVLSVLVGGYAAKEGFAKLAAARQPSSSARGAGLPENAATAPAAAFSPSSVVAAEDDLLSTRLRKMMRDDFGLEPGPRPRS